MIDSKIIPCFRPLSGIKVSEPLHDGLKYHEYRVFVPSRGLRYLNDWVCLALLIPIHGFRPLSGIKVSELKPTKTIIKYINGFRPLSGIKVSELLEKIYANAWRTFSSPLGD